MTHIFGKAGDTPAPPAIPPAPAAPPAFGAIQGQKPGKKPGTASFLSAAAVPDAQKAQPKTLLGQ